jgi:(2Fe-2S) ferredoxin
MGQYERHVFVCTTGSTCPTQGDTDGFVRALRAEAARAGLHERVRINKAGCFSQCGHGPMMIVYPEDVWYAGVRAEDLEEIVRSHLIGGRPVERLRYHPAKPGSNVLAKAPRVAEERHPTPSPSGGEAGPAAVASGEGRGVTAGTVGRGGEPPSGR